MHQKFMQMAIDIAKESKCVSLAVGCVLAADGERCVSTGVNGTPSGYTNCNSIWDCQCPEHSAWSEEHEIHAEMNAILKLAVAMAEHKPFKVLDAYSTHSPCSNCIKHLLGLMIKGKIKVRNIIYNEVYYRTTPEKLLEQKIRCSAMGVRLVHIDDLTK